MSRTRRQSRISGCKLDRSADKEPSKLPIQKSSFKLCIACPDTGIKVESESDEWNILWIDISAQSPSFHPGANRNGPFIQKGQPAQKRVQTFQQFKFIKFCSCLDTVLVLE